VKLNSWGRGSTAQNQTTLVSGGLERFQFIWNRSSLLESLKAAGIAQGRKAARRVSGAQARPSLIHPRLAGPQP